MSQFFDSRFFRKLDYHPSLYSPCLAFQHIWSENYATKKQVVKLSTLSNTNLG